MDNKHLKIYISSLDSAKDEIILHYNNISENLQTITNLFSNINELFDSKSGKEYERLVNDFLRKTKSDIEKSNTYIINKLTDISSNYWEIYNDVKKSISNDEMENES